jgi:hypothetical protein
MKERRSELEKIISLFRPRDQELTRETCDLYGLYEDVIVYVDGNKIITSSERAERFNGKITSTKQ